MAKYYRRRYRKRRSRKYSRRRIYRRRFIRRRGRRSFRRVRRSTGVRRGTAALKWHSMQTPRRTGIFSVDSAPATFTSTAPTDWLNVTNGKTYTAVSDATGVLQPGLLGDDYTTVINQFKTTWKWIKILAVTFSFDWWKFQGPASTVTQDTNAKFFWLDNLPIADPSNTAREWLANETSANNHGLHGVTKRHGQRWHVTVRPKCMRRGTLWGGQSSDLQTRWFWTSAPWMDMTIADAVATDIRELSHYLGAWAMTGLQTGDEVRYTVQVKFAVKEPLVV